MLKLNIRKKGTLVTNGLLGNLVKKPRKREPSKRGLVCLCLVDET